jgi:quinol monooxygenase YgiN
MTKLWISAGLKATQEKPIQSIKQALIELQQMTIQEPGCIQFDLLQHRDNPEQFTLWEEWINEAALTNHFQQPHTKSYLAQQLTEVVYIEKLEKRT